MSSITIKGMGEVLKKSGQAFVRNKVPKLSAALAYYTVFSIGPLLLVIIFLANVLFGQNAMEGTIVNQLGSFVGAEAALQIQEIIKNASIDSSSTFAAVIGFVTLLLGATTVFSEIQDSINLIWNLKIKETAPWWKLLLTRLLSFSTIVALSFLLLVSLIINGLLEGLMTRLQQLFPSWSVVLIYVINLIVTLLVTTFLFAIIYKILPDAKIKWRDVGVGAVFTALLFNIAKFGITIYIGKSDVGSSYGAAGSIIVILLWIYFSSMILYFGAEFTKAYSLKYGGEIRPNNYSVTVQTVVVESNKRTVQENEIDAEQTQQKVQREKDKEINRNNMNRR